VTKKSVFIALAPGFGDVSQNLVGQPVPLADKHSQAEILQVLDLTRRAYAKAPTSFYQPDHSSIAMSTISKEALPKSHLTTLLPFCIIDMFRQRC